MTENIAKYKIGYVDEETAFLNTFKRRMRDEFDVVLFNLDDENADLSLNTLIKKIEESDLDCLIVDFDLKEAQVVGFFGDEVIERMKVKYPHLPYFIITSKEEADVLGHVEDNELVRLKDEINDKPDVLKQRISNKIQNYHNHINEAKTAVKELVELKNSVGLDPKQEETLLKHYQFLDSIYPDEKLLPDSLKTIESMTRLTDFVHSTQGILDELKRINQ